MTTGLEASVLADRGDLNLQVALRVERGETVAIVGPNGAGKSSVLRCLAGLLPLRAGQIVLDGRVLDSPESGVYVDPGDRAIGTVFQDNRLFPHLRVLDNVAFGPRSAGLRRRAARRQADEWLERLGIGATRSKRVGELSGGQARRVAIARAVVTDPRLVLLDEPFTGLDASARIELRRTLLDGLGDSTTPLIVVTHDPADAHTLADRMVVIEDGSVTQRGTPAQIRSQPATEYVAQLVGVNLLSGTRQAGLVQLDGGGLSLAVAQPGPAGRVTVAVDPSAVALHAAAPAGSPRNSWQTRVAAIHRLGGLVRVYVDDPVPLAVDVTESALRELQLGAGVPVWVAIKATGITVSPR